MDQRDLIFYHIYALGFCGAEKVNDFSKGIEQGLRQIIDYVPRLKALGTNALYIGPLFEAETHGYDTIDYYKVDRRLGSDEDLKALVQVCHQHDMIVVLDCVFNHVSRSHFAFRDIIEKGQDSIYKSWFKGIDFSKKSPYQDAFTYETWDGHYQLVKFDLTNEQVRQYLINVALYWMDTFDIDGLRMDAANVMDLEFLKMLSSACKAKRQAFFMLGEIVGGDYARLVREGQLDAITNYECYKGLYSSLYDANYFEIAYALKRQFGQGGLLENSEVYNFVDNHDVNRVASELKRESHLYPLYVMLYTMPGIPSVYYLSEYGKKGKRTAWSDDALRTPFHENEYEVSHPLFQSIGRLAAIRKELKALRYGDYSEVLVASEQLVFQRSYEGEQVLVLLNASDQQTCLGLPSYCNGKYWDVLNNNEIRIQGQVQVDPNWGRILRLVEF